MSFTKPTPQANPGQADNGAHAASRAATLERSPAFRSPRWLFRIAVLLAVSPIFISAIRNGLAHWVPTYDAATTAVRVNDVFSAHPPQVGLGAATSIKADSTYSFPGALELYLLAVPVRLLGNTWGVLLGMATINTGFAVSFAWLVRRRVGEIGGIVACAFLASLLWTAGSQVIIDLTPLQIGLVPFAALMAAAWSVADGDAPALAILAVAGNYLILDQLKFSVVVPAMVIYAVLMLLFMLRRARRTDPDSWIAIRRRHIRWALFGGAFTALAWFPPIYQQFTSPGGNLGKLLDVALHDQVAVAQSAKAAPTLLGSISTVVATTAVPPLWLRPTFAHPTFHASGAGTPFVYATLCISILFGLNLLLWLAARRRGDRTLMMGIGASIVGWMAWVVTATQNPNIAGFLAPYFHELWSLAMFMWMVVVLGILRTWPIFARRRSERLTGQLGLVTTALLAALTVPHANFGAGTQDGSIQPAREINRIVKAHFRGRGPVRIISDLDARPYQGTAMLALQEIGVPFQVRSAYDLELFGANRRFSIANPTATEVLRLRTIHGKPEGARLIGFVPSSVYPLSQSEFRSIDRTVRRWAASTEMPRTSPKLSVDSSKRRELDAGLAELMRESRQSGVSVVDTKGFREGVIFLDRHGFGPFVDIPGLTPNQVFQWADIVRRRGVYLYSYPVHAARTPR